MPLFSIITVNLNNADGLRRTIESVVSQTFTNFEYIVIDGASSDSSVDVIKSFASKITYWISEKDTGIYNAMNKGIVKAKGDYLLFLNSGDYLADKDVLQKVADAKPVEDLIFGDMIIKEKNGTTRKGSMPDQLTIVQMYKDTLWHPVTFILRSAFNDFGFYDERFKIAGDYDSFLYLLFKRKSTYRHLPLIVSVFDNTGISANPVNKKLLAEERLLAQKRHFNPILLTLFRLYSFIRK